MKSAPAVVRVHDVQVTSEPPRIELEGEPLSGRVAVGMRVSIPLNSSAYLVAQIVSVTTQSDPSRVTIRLECESLEDADLFKAMNLIGDELKCL